MRTSIADCRAIAFRQKTSDQNREQAREDTLEDGPQSQGGTAGSLLHQGWIVRRGRIPASRANARHQATRQSHNSREPRVQYLVNL